MYNIYIYIYIYIVSYIYIYIGPDGAHAGPERPEPGLPLHAGRRGDDHEAPARQLRCAEG